MLYYVLSISIFLLVMLGMSVGVIFNGKPIKGSCGGRRIGMDGKEIGCEWCGNGKSHECPNKPKSS